MIIGSMSVTLNAPWVNSLKEKRMIVKSIIARVRNKFNVSIAEVEYQDIHKTIGIGIVCVTGVKSHANSILDEVLNYIEASCEADIRDFYIEII